MINAIVEADTATCTNGVINTDGKVVVRQIIGATRYSFGSDPTLLGFSHSQGITSDSIEKKGLVAGRYYIRVFGADSTCFLDTTATIQGTQCPCYISATFSQGICNNSATTSTSIDDYFTVTINSRSLNGGLSNKYEVVINGSTVVNLGGTAYNSPITFGASGLLIADGTTIYAITVRDYDNNQCVSQTFLTKPVVGCSSQNACETYICLPVLVLRQK